MTWAPDHPIVVKLVELMRATPDSPDVSSVSRVLDALDRHRDAAPLGQFAAFDNPDIIPVLRAVSQEVDEGLDVVQLIAHLYEILVIGNTFNEDIRPDRPDIRALAERVELPPDLVAAMLRRDFEYLSRNGEDGHAVYDRLWPLIKRAVFREALGDSESPG